MRHVFIAETRRFISGHLHYMNQFYFDCMSNPTRETVTVRCKWSGRIDTIRCVVSEYELHGHRYDGQLVLLEDNNFTYGLYMHAIHNRKITSGRKGAEDEETLFWHWATEDTYGRVFSDDRDCFAACIQSVKAMDAQERARKRS